MSERFSKQALALASLTTRVKNQPIAVANGAAGLLALAVSFGLPLSPDQKIELSSAFVAVGNWWAHTQVVPVNKLVQGTVTQSAAGAPVTITAPDGATTTVGSTP